MGNFWFEDKSTDKYYTFGKKVEKKYIPKRTAKQKAMPSMSINTLKTDEDGREYYEHTVTDYQNKIYHSVVEWDNRHNPDFEVGDIYRSGDITPLTRVDELVCEFMGEDDPSAKEDSTFYFWLHETAYMTLYSKGGSYIGDRDTHLPELHERMDKWIALVKEKHSEHPVAIKLAREGYVARCHALIDWVFVTKWRFHGSA